jgi:hypothetical protein
MNKRYCSHCGTPNPVHSKTCAKCGKPLSSGLKIPSYSDAEEEVVIVKKRPTQARKIRYVDEDGNDLDDDSFAGEIVTPKMSDVIIEKPQKLTVAALKNGAQVNVGGGFEQLPPDIEVKSRTYFHQENLD